MPKPDLEPRRQLGGEMVIPVIAVAFTLYFFATIWNSPWTAQVSAFLVGGILLLVCAIFFVRALFWLRNGTADLSMSNLVSIDDLRSGRIGLIATTVAYCLFIDQLGFTLTTFLFLAISMIILSKGQRPVLITAISALMALGGWAVFIWAFDTRFPRGLFEMAMKALMSDG